MYATDVFDLALFAWSRDGVCETEREAEAGCRRLLAEGFRRTRVTPSHESPGEIPAPCERDGRMRAAGKGDQGRKRAV